MMLPKVLPVLTCLDDLIDFSTVVDDVTEKELLEAYFGPVAEMEPKAFRSAPIKDDESYATPITESIYVTSQLFGIGERNHLLP